MHNYAKKHYYVNTTEALLQSHHFRDQIAMQFTFFFLRAHWSDLNMWQVRQKTFSSGTLQSNRILQHSNVCFVCILERWLLWILHWHAHEAAAAQL